MNKLNVFYLVFAINILFVSCEKKDKDDLAINSIKTNLPVDGFLTVESNSDFTFKISVENKNEIKSFKIEKFNGSILQNTIIDSAISATTQLVYDLRAKSGNEERIESYVFTYIDKNNKSYSKTILVNVLLRIIKYDAKLFAGDSINLKAKNIINLYSNATYTMPEGDKNNTLADLYYLFNDSLICKDRSCSIFIDSVASAIGNPSSKNIRFYFNDRSFGVQTWDNRNNTLFSDLGNISLVDFNAISDEKSIDKLAINLNQSIIPFLKEGSFIAFKTVNSKLGLIRINKIIPGFKGNIELSVIIHKF